MEMVLQFCFVTLFSLVLPLVPLITYVSNILEVGHAPMHTKKAHFLL